jgi:hypothetical protein
MRKATMRLPKFWRDTGRWNDPVVSAGIIVGMAGWGGLGWWLGKPWLLLAAVFLGPVSGLFLGLAVVAVLCRFFAETKDRTQGSTEGR